MRIAAIDIGTNSVLMLIAETRAGGAEGGVPANAGPLISPLLERATITRLGEGVDRSRELAPAARARTLECLRDYAGDIARYERDARRTRRKRARRRGGARSRGATARHRRAARSGAHVPRHLVGARARRKRRGVRRRRWEHRDRRRRRPSR